MSGFNEDSQMPEVASGGDESAVVTDHDAMSDAQPSVASTDRYGLQANGNGFLLRKYDIKDSAAGNPYFAPVQSMLNTFIDDFDAVIAEARAHVLADKDLQARVKALVKPAAAYLAARIEDAGESRAWLARSLVIWPLTDQVGFQGYKAASGEADLLDFATYIFRTDANMKTVKDLATHEKFQTRSFWTDVAYDELGVVDALITEIDESSIDYNVGAILKSGYQSAANLDTRKYLRGVNGNSPVTEDTASAEIRAEVLASRRISSQVAA